MKSLLVSLGETGSFDGLLSHAVSRKSDRHTVNKAFIFVSGWRSFFLINCEYSFSEDRNSISNGYRRYLNVKPPILSVRLFFTSIVSSAKTSRNSSSFLLMSSLSKIN